MRYNQDRNTMKISVSGVLTLLIMTGSMGCFLSYKKLSHLPTSTTSKIVKFDGEINRGEEFEKEIVKNIFFRLKPQDLGWDIEVRVKQIQVTISSLLQHLLTTV